MKISINLSEWFKNQFSINLIKSHDSDLLNQLSTLNSEIDQIDLESHKEKIQALQELGLKITNLRTEFPLFTCETDEILLLEKSFELLKKWEIKNLTITETSFYPGDDVSLTHRLSSQVIETEKWLKFCDKLNRVGAACEQRGAQLMIANRSGTLIEEIADFEKIADHYKYGFYFDMPHLLYVSEKLNQISPLVKSKVKGMRMGSYNPCSWVPTRLGGFSWNASVSSGIFEPYKVEQKKMLNNFSQFVIDHYHQLKTISLTCERKNELNNPLLNFNVANKAFSEIILSEVKKA